jgi:hypothetical protein
MKKKTIIFILGGLFFIAVITVVILISTGVFSSTTTTTPGTTTTKPPKNDCNTKPSDSKTYILAYSDKESRSRKSKTNKQYWWKPAGADPIKCYLDKTTTSQVPSLDHTNCSNYYAIGPDKRGYQCTFDEVNTSQGCVVDYNGNSYMNHGNLCPKDYKESGPWPTQK